MCVLISPLSLPSRLNLPLTVLGNPKPHTYTYDVTGTVAMGVVLLVLVILFLAFQRRIEDWLRPFADWMHEYVGFLRNGLSSAQSVSPCMYAVSDAVSGGAS